MGRVDAGAERHPAWCVVDHARPGAPSEHQADGVAVPVVALAAIRGQPSTAEARELVVVLHGDEEHRWLYVGDGEDQLLDLDPEGWRRVVAAVEVVLARAE
ncbi:hypothetical protein EDD28_0170 [Salana multivorans]|uniref:Uncharacterized protein n=1 Tax=Salana multivorans TaxID=120377 RepID=A0A3N2D751_9MICO|nr:hypothetical protein [Salana multivorans]ROR95609.1 hypothetical protein EDD28_0170 [Salana multivorans]